MQVVPFESWVQYPRVPNVMLPLMPSTESPALRKYIDLIHGTQNVTTARSTVAGNILQIDSQKKLGTRRTSKGHNETGSRWSEESHRYSSELSDV